MPAAPPTIDDAELELEQAVAARDDLIDRIAAGEQIKPSDVSNAETAVHLAEMRGAGAQRRAEQDAEQQRRDRVAQLRASLTDGNLAKLAAELAECHEAATEALAALVEANNQYDTTLRTTLSELRSLALAGPPLAGLDVNGSQRDVVRIDGSVWRIPANDESPRAVADAALAVIGRGPLLRGVDRATSATTKAQRAVDRHRDLTDGPTPHDPTGVGG